MLLHQGETFADRRQHAQGQAIDLEDAQFVEVVFVPLDDRPLRGMAAFSIGTSSHNGPRVMTMPPVCCERCRGKPTNCPTSSINCRAAVRSMTGHRVPASGQRSDDVGLARKCSSPLGQPVDLLGGHAQRAAHVADGGAGAVGDHFGRHAGPLAAVFLVEILQDLLAALVLEVDVDVGGFVPLAADEPLEQEVHPLGIDGGHAQAEADGRVGRRAAALAEDAATAGEDDEVPDGEKVGLVVQLFDQLQFVLDRGPAPCRARRPGSGSARLPKPAGSDIPSASGPPGRVPRGTHNATRRARRSSAGRFPACAARPRDSGRRARPFPAAIAGIAGHWETAVRRPWPPCSRAARRRARR